MNVAIFTESYTPYVNGVAVSVATFTEQLRKRGDTVYIFAPRMPGYKDEDPHVFRYPSVRTPFEPEYPLTIPKMPVLNHVLRSLPVDIIHTQSPFALGVEGARWARRRRVPLVTTYHTMYTEYTHYVPFIPKPIARHFLIRWSRNNCNNADMVIAPSESTRDVLQEWGVTSPITVLATGIQMEMFRGGSGSRVRAELGLSADSLVLLYAGRIAREKNVPLLFEMLKRVLVERPDAVLVLVGGGPTLSEMKRTAEQMRLESSTIFTGFIKRESMRDYYAAADLFVFPSQTETQGLVICEAMAAGLPCVAADSAAAREVLENGHEGSIVAPDADAMAGEVIRLANAPDERRLLSERGSTTARRFGVDESADELRRIYSAVLEGRRQTTVREKTC